jgi:hypothetical protein
MAAVDRKLLEAYEQCRTDFRFFGENCLKIKNKLGNPQSFTWNSAQELLHESIEEQKRRTGRVRKIIVKGRQQGVSTYVGARYYHNTTMNRGRNTFILSHKKDTTDALAAIVDRYQKHNPFAPQKGKDNVLELEFPRLDASYYLETAGAQSSGRGKTSLNFHGSEVAFWNNAGAHFSGSVQTVPDDDGTEVCLESTANGVTGAFYERTQDAIQRRGDYELCFIPWYLQKEYTRRVPEGFELSDALEDAYACNIGLSEREYMEMFELTLGQMVWRRNKIHELKAEGGLSLFDQEYPATVELAFQQKAEGAYHKVSDILKARKRTGVHAAGPLILGVDPAGEGGDRFAIAFRRGHVCEKIIWRDKVTHDEAVEWLKSVIDEANPALVFIDAGGLGKAIITSLRAKGPAYNLPRVHAVNFGGKSQAKLARPQMPGPKMRRDEMQQRVAEWLADPNMPPSIPDLDTLQADLIEMKIKKINTNDLQLESKQEIKARGGRSPDLADALGLTFADLIYVKNFAPPKQQTNFMEDAPKTALIQPSLQEVIDYGGDDWGGGSGSWMG